jgi:glycine cleavage system H protein
MSNIPADLKYTKSHEWIRVEKDGSCVVGITDHAQSMLGDFVYVNVPDVGATFAAGKECCVVESVKAASDVYMPIAGTIKEANGELAKASQLVNQDPYGKGWLFRFTPSNAGDLNTLLDAKAYAEVEKADAH